MCVSNIFHFLHVYYISHFWIKYRISHDRGSSFRCVLIDSTDFIIHGFVPVLNPSDRKAALIGQSVPSEGHSAHWKVAIVDVTHYLERPCEPHTLSCDVL